MPPPNWGKSIPFSPLFPGSKCDFHAQDTPSQEGAAEPEGLHLVQGAEEGTGRIQRAISAAHSGEQSKATAVTSEDSAKPRCGHCEGLAETAHILIKNPDCRLNFRKKSPSSI